MIYQSEAKERSSGMEIVYKSIDELTPYENNPRHNENAVAAVAASIKGV